MSEHLKCKFDVKNEKIHDKQPNKINKKSFDPFSSNNVQMSRLFGKKLHSKKKNVNKKKTPSKHGRKFLFIARELI